MSFTVPAALETELNELLTHYPQKRSASLMFLHAVQEHFGYISREAMENARAGSWQLMHQVNRWINQLPPLISKQYKRWRIYEK